jgi:hypothetical protein
MNECCIYACVCVFGFWERCYVDAMSVQLCEYSMMIAYDNINNKKSNSYQGDHFDSKYISFFYSLIGFLW